MPESLQKSVPASPRILRHRGPSRLGGDPVSIAWWSARRKPTTLLFFIHGFCADVSGSWQRFPELLPGRAETVDADIVFWGYSSSHRLGALAARLRSGLQDVQAVRAAKGTSGQGEAYTRIVIVAHSLGSVIARRALLDALESKEQWTSITRLVLYAPAHHGVDLLPLADEIGGFVRTLVGLAKAFFPVLRELEPGSPQLSALRVQSESHLGTISEDAVRAALVIHASGDRVVSTEPFGKDAETIFYADCTHLSVCRPSDGNDFVFQDLCKCLNAKP